MNIARPEWHLQNVPCPCSCGGQGALLFLVCPHCSLVVLACDEVGTIFPNPLNLKTGPQLSRVHENNLCPGCISITLPDFESANSDQIQAAGFKVGDYS